MDENEQFRQWFCELKDRRNNRHMDEPDFDRAVWEHITRHTARQVLIGRIETLENLKLYNGAYIGIDGKRVDNMVSHAFIDERIAELQSELARLEKEGGARTGLSCHGKVLRPSRQQSHRAS